MGWENLHGKMCRFYGQQKKLAARLEKSLGDPAKLYEAEKIKMQLTELRGVIKGIKLAIDYVDAERTTNDLPFSEFKAEAEAKAKGARRASRMEPPNETL